MSGPVGTCVRCGEHCWAPRWHSEYRTEGPRVEWGPHYQISAIPEHVDVSDGGRLYLYCYCRPSCRANAAVTRYERARLEIAAALEELQAAVVAALEEVGEAWNELDR